MKLMFNTLHIFVDSDILNLGVVWNKVLQNIRFIKR